jgi:hypothetical protein
VSLRPSKDRRYRVTDPYLRFWLHLLGLSMEEIERGRGDLTLARIRENWTSWRGRAVEPLVREALARILPDERLPAAAAVGGYWTRTNDVEIDIVGADLRSRRSADRLASVRGGWQTWQGPPRGGEPGGCGRPAVRVGHSSNPDPPWAKPIPGTPVDHVNT